MSGGGQERGLRSGTLPTHLVVGLGMACQVAKEVRDGMGCRGLGNQYFPNFLPDPPPLSPRCSKVGRALPARALSAQGGPGLITKSTPGQQPLSLPYLLLPLPHDTQVNVAQSPLLPPAPHLTLSCRRRWPLTAVIFSVSRSACARGCSRGWPARSSTAPQTWRTATPATSTCRSRTSRGSHSSWGSRCGRVAAVGSISPPPCPLGGHSRGQRVVPPSISQNLTLSLKPSPLQDIAVSSGSACTSASLEPSYVLRALGVEEDMAHTSIRCGVGAIICAPRLIE